MSYQLYKQKGGIRIQVSIHWCGHRQIAAGSQDILSHTVWLKGQQILLPRNPDGMTGRLSFRSIHRDTEGHKCG